MRPPHTVATVKTKVNAANSITCPRLLLRTGRSKRRVSGDNVGASALMAHIHNLKVVSKARAAPKIALTTS